MPYAAELLQEECGLQRNWLVLKLMSSKVALAGQHLQASAGWRD
jgi:hypothetical protein